MSEHLDKLMQRARQYWYSDGLAELIGGGLFLLVGLYFYIQAILPPESLLANLLAPGLMLLIIGGGLVARRILQALKSRLTYPRTGYVAYPTPGRWRRIATALVAMVMAGLISSIFSLWPVSLTWIPAFSGLVIGMATLYYGHRLGLVRFYLLAVYSALLGMGASLSGWSEGFALAAYYGLMAPALMLSGLLTLRAYLRATRSQGAVHER